MVKVAYSCRLKTMVDNLHIISLGYAKCSTKLAIHMTLYITIVVGTHVYVYVARCSSAALTARIYYMQV